MDQLEQFMMHHWQLWLALIILLILIYLNEIITQKKQAKALSTSEAIAMINHEEAIVIDLRNKELFRNGHIIHSVNASSDDFTEKRMEKYKTKPLIFVCAKGLQSASLANKLKRQGFNQPLVLAGGISAWTTANLPLAKGK